MRILSESHYAFVIKCWFNELHFESFHGIFLFHYFDEAFYTCDSITPFDSDLTQKLVQGACYETSCSYFHSFYDHAKPFLFQLFFKIFKKKYKLQLTYIQKLQK